MIEDETSPSEAAPESAVETPTPEETRRPRKRPCRRKLHRASISPVCADFSPWKRRRPRTPKPIRSSSSRNSSRARNGSCNRSTAAIVLASDGVIRWLGDPVARLVAGEEVLKPRAVLLADDALPTENREAAERRLIALGQRPHPQDPRAAAGARCARRRAGRRDRRSPQKLIGALGVLEPRRRAQAGQGARSERARRAAQARRAVRRQLCLCAGAAEAGGAGALPATLGPEARPRSRIPTS